MRFDAQNQLSVAQAFTGAATVSTNSYAMQSVNQDISIGRMMSIFVSPTVAAGAGSSCLMEVITASDAALTANISVICSLTVAAANLTVGAVQEIPIPKGSLGQLAAAGNLGQYLGIRVTLTGGTTTITLDAYLMPSDDIARFKSFPKVADALV